MEGEVLHSGQNEESYASHNQGEEYNEGCSHSG